MKTLLALLMIVATPVAIIEVGTAALVKVANTPSDVHLVSSYNETDETRTERDR